MNPNQQFLWTYELPVICHLAYSREVNGSFVSGPTLSEARASLKRAFAGHRFPMHRVPAGARLAKGPRLPARAAA